MRVIKEEILRQKYVVWRQEVRRKEITNTHLRGYIYICTRRLFFFFLAHFPFLLYQSNLHWEFPPHGKAFFTVWLTEQINSGTQWLEGLIREEQFLSFSFFFCGSVLPSGAAPKNEATESRIWRKRLFGASGFPCLLYLLAAGNSRPIFHLGAQNWGVKNLRRLARWRGLLKAYFFYAHSGTEQV